MISAHNISSFEKKCKNRNSLDFHRPPSAGFCTDLQSQPSKSTAPSSSMEITPIGIMGQGRISTGHPPRASVRTFRELFYPIACPPLRPVFGSSNSKCSLFALHNTAPPHTRHQEILSLFNYPTYARSESWNDQHSFREDTFSRALGFSCENPLGVSASSPIQVELRDRDLGPPAGHLRSPTVALSQRAH